MRKPVVYFAGRNNGWRDELGLNPTVSVDFGTFFYGGPFIIDPAASESRPDHQQIWWDADRSWIERADLIVAYIDDLHAYGTLVEIGYAAAKGKPIALGFSNNMAHVDYMELWLCRTPAAKIYRGTPKEVWREVQHDWVQPTSAAKRSFDQDRWDAFMRALTERGRADSVARRRRLDRDGNRQSRRRRRGSDGSIE
jgi:hypothetical protein